MATAIRPSRKALRQARSAQFLGDRRKEAESTGPIATLAVAMDQLRSAIAHLPESGRAAAAARATQMLDQLRQNLTES
ncbi:hypothetical protein ACIRJM_22980 [Streptomyces sp. NPDC102405]|uniref:hypothetical protein n=1 Tax=Streptomyces sp. NPDC102405 TaxID=3366170 RepID=UPI003813D3A5